MVATILVGMLCAHLLCFAVMFLLISKRLHGKTMGMDFFAVGNLLLGLAYVLQLLEGGPAWSVMSVVNHTFTLASPVVFWLGAMRFFGHAVPLWRPLLAVVVAYTSLQVLVQWSLGPVARYAMLSGMSALLFLVMASTVVYGVRTFAKDLYAEMVFFAALISGISLLNAIKFLKLLQGGLVALQMDANFQLVFYIYMSFLATVLPPSIVWLVLRRLTDELRHQAARDPMTQLLNRRGLTDALKQHFNARHAGAAHLLLIDVDHFKHINDTYGHQAGDAVLCHVAQVLQATVRRGDLAGRIGGKSLRPSAWMPMRWAWCIWRSACVGRWSARPFRPMAVISRCAARSRWGCRPPSWGSRPWTAQCAKPMPPCTVARQLGAIGWRLPSTPMIRPCLRR